MLVETICIVIDYNWLYSLSYYLRAGNNEPIRVTPSAFSG